MKILALVSEAFGGFGGISQYNRDLLGALSSCGRVSEITVLPRRSGTDDIVLPAGVNQETAPGGKTGFIHRAWRLCQLQKFDLVLCGHINLLPVASFVANRQGINIWLVVYGIDAWQQRLASKYLSNLVLVTAISRYTRNRFAELNPLDPACLKVLSCTVDPMFTPGAKSLSLLQRHDLLESEVLLTVGRLNVQEQYKGQDRVLALMPRLLRQRPNLAYVIVGDGDDLPRLEGLANELGLGDHVKFVNAVPDTELVQWYRSADVFVMPSSGEGFGIVFLQAAACGLRVIGGNRDGSVDALRDGKLGMAVDPMSQDQLARAICDQLDAATYPVAVAVGCFSFSSFQRQVGLIVDYIAG